MKRRSAAKCSTMAAHFRNKEQEAALLKWVNTFPIGSRIEYLSDLCDGLAFAGMLEDFDKQYALSELEKNPSGPTDWLNKKSVLETVFKSLLRYIHNHTNGLEHLTATSMIDLNKIAEHDDVEETIKLLAVFLVAAAYCPERERYLNGITNLGEETATQLGEVIKKMAIEQSKLTKDAALATEEEYATLKAEHEKTRKRNGDLHTRIEELQIRNQELHESIEELQKKNQALEEANHGDQAHHIQRLFIEKQECENIIATQEQQIEDNRIEKERLNRELDKRPSAARIEKLNDELTMVKLENETLTKRANAADKYHDKLKRLNSIEDDNKRLRENVDVLESNQKFFDEVIAEKDHAQNAVKEYSKKFQQYENTQLDLEAEIRRLREELHSRNSDIERLNNQVAHDEEFIKGLEEQIQIGDPPPQSLDSPTSKAGHMTLEEELAEPNYDLEISRLKATNQALRSTNAGTNLTSLQIKLDETEIARKRLERNLQELTERHAIGQEQLKAIINTSTSEKDETIAHTRRLYLEANQELSLAKRKLNDLQAELSSRDRELLGTKADLSAINSDEMNALEQLKEANEIAASSLQNDLQILQGRHKNLEIDHEQTRSHLIEALLAKDNLTTELTKLKEAKPLESHAEVEKSGLALQSLKEQLANQEGIIQDLEERLKVAKEGGVDAQKAANEALIKNLARENSLMATAWYDLTSRLQSNHVVLQRRPDAPRSWLNKQRQMVNATPRR